MRVAVFASGTGTNLAALLDAEARGQLAPAEIACVVCNRPMAAALEIARAAGKPTLLVDHTAFDSREAFEAAIERSMAPHGVEAIVLAGFMRVLTSGFVARWAGRIMNTHPSLLPAFPGVRAAQQALDYGAKVTGCTIHLVEAAVDGGAIIAQAAVPILDGDDAASLQARIQMREHELLPRAVRDLARSFARAK